MAGISSANAGDGVFGDFKFAAFPGPAAPFNQIGGSDFADDEWGDFVVHPLSNAPSHIQSSSNPSQTSKPFDPFGFFSDDSSKPSESVVSQVVDSVPTRSESEKKQWAKPQGALSLSIFGEDEEEEKEKKSDSPGPAPAIDHKRVDSAKHGPKLDPVVGITDIISKLYSQNHQIKAENASPTVSNERNLNSSLDSNVLHADLVDGDDGFHDDDDDDGWEFKAAVPDNSKVQVGSGLLGLKVETTTKSEIQAGQENSDGGKYTSGFPNALGGSSFLAASNGLWQESSDGTKRASGFHNASDSSSDFFAASNGWQETFLGTKNSSGFHNPPHSSTSFFDATNGLWQESVRTKNTSGFHNLPDNSSGFFDASNGIWKESKDSGFHIASGNSRDLFDATIGLWQESEGAKHASGSPDGPDKSNDIFDASNELWQEKTEASKLPSGFHTAPDSSGVLFAESHELWQKISGGAKHTSEFMSAPNISTDFFATSNGLWQDHSEGSKISSGFHNVSDSSTGLSKGLFDEPSKLDIGFEFGPAIAKNDSVAVPKSTGEQIHSENVMRPCLDDENLDPDEDFGDFKDAFGQEEDKVAGVSCPVDQFPIFDGGIQANEGRPTNHSGALPLDLFSDGVLEADDSLNHQDIWAFEANSNPRNGPTCGASSIPINDLISSLYNQSEPSTSIDSAQKPSENGFNLAETVQDSNAVKSNDDFDDDSWEFKDAFSGANAEELTSGHVVENVIQSSSIKVELKDYVDFYMKLKEKSCLVALCHLDNLKKAKTVAALSGEDVRAEALNKEIKEACQELSLENMLPKEAFNENGAHGDSCFDGILEDLHGPKFLALESEYHLSRRLSLAQKDLRSAVELFKHVTFILKIVMMGSMEEKSNYFSTWSRMISVCAQELRHGAFIWKQSLQKNVYSQILLEPRGQKFILALGEIYRVVEVLGASARLFKPWVLLSSEKVDIFDLLEECSTIWSSLGLEDALHCLCDPFGFEYDGTVHALLASIKYVHDLDVLSLEKHVLAQQKPICQLSLLTPEMVPGMKMVVWNGNHYFLTLANLWANLISSDPPPKLPDLRIV